MMLRKKTRTPQRQQSGNQRMSDSVSESSLSSDADRKTRGNSLFALPGLFVGITKGLPDSDPSRSPTSPLDCRVFSGLGNYLARSPRSPDPNGPRWDCEPIRLGLLDALDDESAATSCGRVQGSSGSRNMLLGSQMRIRSRELKTSFDRLLAEEGSSASPRSLPKNYAISSRTRTILPVNLQCGSPETGVELPGTPFEIGEPGKIRSFSADVDGLIWGRQNLLSSGVLRVSPFARRFMNNGKSSGSPPISHGFVGSLSASDIEQSEDYTCIISRGPNPKTTHIFGDCILESHHASDSSDSITTNRREEDKKGSAWMVTCSEEPVGVPFSPEDFLRVCYSCKKKLEGKDIYMYRGEKAFCSCSCRSQEMMEEEGLEEPAAASHASPASSFCEEFFLAGIDFAT